MTASERAARLAAAAAIAASVLLAATWTFVVPIFQAPDEPAHFDDAMSILRAGRLVRVTDGPKVWIATPDVEYLLRATDFDRVAWHSTMKEPADYGTPAYFHRLDAGAPPVNRPSQPPERINYITTSYPYGFYLLEAVWMGLIGKLTGSLTAMFFAARLLCVGMLGVGLVCNYYTALLLGMRRWPAAGFIAAIGLLPLTSFVSSYVQPDNLAYALLSAGLLCAVNLVRSGIRPWPVVGMSLALAALAVTKYQFFIAAALPCYGLFAMLLWRKRAAPTALWSAPLAIAVLVLFALPQHWIGGASTAADWVGQSSGSSVLATVAAAPSRAASFFTDCFVSGLCAATYWQVYGWFDTPIAIGNWNSEVVLRVIISLVSTLAAIAVAAFAIKNICRIASLTRHGLGKAGLSLMLADPAFNTYLCLLGIMLALYVLTNDAFGAEGRQFYPVGFVAVLAVLWYAPRSFKRGRVGVSYISTAVVVCYSMAAAGFALHDVAGRYYGKSGSFKSQTPAAKPSSGKVAGGLWPVQSGTYRVGHSSNTFAPWDGHALSTWGVAAFLQTHQAATNVAVIVDARKPMAVATGMYEATIAEGSRSLAYGHSEFFSYLVGPFAEGAHAVNAYALNPKSQRYAWIPPARPFFVTRAAGGQFSAEFQKRVLAAPRVGGLVIVRGVCRGTMQGKKILQISSGAAPLLAVRLNRQMPSDAVVWLDAGGRPFATRWVGAGQYDGIVQTKWLGLGPQIVRAVVTNTGEERHRVVADEARFEILPGTGMGSVGTQRHPKECADPLLQFDRDSD